MAWIRLAGHASEEDGFRFLFSVGRHLPRPRLTTGMIWEIIPAVKAKQKQQEIYAPRDVQIPARLGGGVLKERVIRELPSRKVTSYALAYINSQIHPGDNGRVLGYDNSHGYSHRHYMGRVMADAFPGYEALYDRFEREWREIAIKFVNGEM